MFYSGLLLSLLSLVLFLMHVRVGSFNFWGSRVFGFVNPGAIILIMIIVSFIALLVKPCKVTKLLLPAMIIILIINIIVSLNIYLVSMSIFTLLLILAPGCVGIALIIKGLIK